MELCPWLITGTETQRKNTRGADSMGGAPDGRS